MASWFYFILANYIDSRLGLAIVTSWQKETMTQWQQDNTQLPKICSRGTTCLRQGDGSLSPCELLKLWFYQQINLFIMWKFSRWKEMPRTCVRLISWVFNSFRLLTTVCQLFDVGIILIMYEQTHGQVTDIHTIPKHTHRHTKHIYSYTNTHLNDTQLDKKTTSYNFRVNVVLCVFAHIHASDLIQWHFL